MVSEKAKEKIGQNPDNKVGQLEIIYYTDPLCCWSWAMEPQVRRLQFEFNGQIAWRYCMGGLLPGWENYHDEINSVSRPIQMGPVWMHAQQVSGMPMSSTIWMKDPPTSSYPSCIAFRCVALQSGNAAKRYLRLLREALMIEEKNIAREAILLEVAIKLSEEPGYDIDITRFKIDLKNDSGLNAFREDLQETRYRNINRFPTFIVKGPQHDGIIITGYRPYPVILESINRIAPHLEKTNSRITRRRIQKILGYSHKKGNAGD